MAYNYFQGWTEAQLLAARMAAQKSLSQGLKTVSFNAGDVGGSNFSEFGSDWALAQLEISLWILNPTKYPLQLPVNRTRVAFSPPMYLGPVSYGGGWLQ